MKEKVKTLQSTSSKHVPNEALVPKHNSYYDKIIKKGGKGKRDGSEAMSTCLHLVPAT